MPASKTTRKVISKDVTAVFLMADPHKKKAFYAAHPVRCCRVFHPLDGEKWTVRLLEVTRFGKKTTSVEVLVTPFAEIT